MVRFLYALLCLFLASAAVAGADQPVLVDSTNYAWTASNSRIASSAYVQAFLSVVALSWMSAKL